MSTGRSYLLPSKKEIDRVGASRILIVGRKVNRDTPNATGTSARLSSLFTISILAVFAVNIIVDLILSKVHASKDAIR